MTLLSLSVLTPTAHALFTMSLSCRSTVQYNSIPRLLLVLTLFPLFIVALFAGARPESGGPLALAGHPRSSCCLALDLQSVCGLHAGESNLFDLLGSAAGVIKNGVMKLKLLFGWKVQSPGKLGLAIWHVHFCICMREHACMCVHVHTKSLTKFN